MYNLDVRMCRNISSEEKRQVLRKRREIRKVRHETHALRMDMMYRLSLAKHVRVCITSSLFLVY